MTAASVSRNFRRAVKEPGIAGAAKHLFRPRYETITAVDDVSLSIEAGESVAYLGQNGAGKSTTIKLLTGILVPSSGTVTVCGLTPQTDRVRNAYNISVMFGQRTQLWWDIPVVESLRLLGDIYQVPTADFRQTMDELIDVLDLGPLLKVPARQLSLGQRTRCDLGAALIHRPRVLFLDEPTIGLDVSVKARLREFIRLTQRERGLTLMLTSHDLGDVEDLCSRVVMIDKGRIVHDGPFAEVQRQYGWEKTVTITLAESAPTAAGRLRERLAAHQANVESAGETLVVRFDSRATSPGELIREAVLALPVADVAITEPSAEAIVRQLYEGRLAFDGPATQDEDTSGSSAP